MATQEEIIGIAVDKLITKYRTTTIKYYPYVAGSVDTYKQRTKTFGSAVELVGRAIVDPTSEEVTAVGSGESYDIAFLFSRLEMIRKFPLADEGEWMQPDGEMEWRGGRRYRIEKVKPSGQVGVNFTLMIVLANTIRGSRD